MALLRNGRVVTDSFLDATGLDVPPTGEAVIVRLDQWREHRESLLAAGAPVGVRLRSDEPPALIAADLGQLALVALEFPKFRDGRAYTHARMLRERLGFAGEIRAVGDVLQEQLHFMQRCGFDAFEISAPDPEQAWAAISQDHSVWYQATGDGRPRALELRRDRLRRDSLP